MKTALLMTTYNRPDALELCLESAFAQSVMPAEIIVADDGSGDVTRELMEKMAEKSPVPLLHCWQEDQGFRAARCRNLALARATAPYVIYIDGDMVLHRHFVKDHLHHARPGTFIQGSRVLLSGPYTQAVLQDKNLQPSLRAPGTGNAINGLYLPPLAFLLSQRAGRSHKGIRSCNLSFFREDALGVNGFNEDFVTWGREDSELVERFFNAGILRRNLKFGAIQYHLHHAEGRAGKASDEILLNTQAQQLAWCENGVDKHLG